ncbi:MAG: outer membrane lipoprotein carrier protein LolA [Paludibacteraceae bacterium]|nr:outer membrane lipoprotein carrier protein LolA [Paludibacteraceae bacterium]
MKLLLTILTILSSFMANLEQKTLQSAFTVTVAEEVNAPMNYPGEIIMQGNKFRLEMMDIEAAYDGKTMYMYSGQTDELTLSNPTDQELLEANPFLYAKALVPVCNVTERTTQDGQQTIVTLTPKDQSIGINRFVLKVRNSDLMPLSVEIKEGKKTSTLKMKDPKFVAATPEYIFILKPSKNTYVNDMRF